MSSSTVKAIPDGMHTLTPHLVCGDAPAAIEFYKRAFGGTETGRMAGPDGKIIHAAVKIGDSNLYLVEEAAEHGMAGPKTLKGSPVTIHLQVEDADATLARAVAEGAEVTLPIFDAPWGDRYGQFRDPFGHHWSIATHVRDLTSAEISAAMEQAFA